MSIYRSILEEQLDAPILDDNNSPELKEIEDIVNDHDANEFEQAEAQEADFGPDDVDDILDESFIAIAEAEANFNKLTMAIGLHELNEAAAGRDIIYEAVDIKGFFAKAKKWVVDFFKKVWQVLQRFGANISATFRTNKSFMKKYGDKLNAGYNAFKNDGKIKLKKYSYSGLNTLTNSEKWNTANGTSVYSEINKYKSAIASWKDGGAAVEEITLETIDRILKEYRGYLLGDKSKGCEASEFREKLTLHIRGSEDKVEGKMEVKEIEAALKEGLVKECKKAIDGAKKDYNDTLKHLKDLERSISRNLDSDGTDKQKTSNNSKIAVVYRMTDLFKGVLTATQVSRACVLNAIRARAGQARMYAQAYIAAVNKDSYKGFQKESTEYGFLSGIELV